MLLSAISFRGIPLEQIAAVVVGLLTLLYAAWVNKWKLPSFKKFVPSNDRGADDPPPPGAQQWAVDIAKAMGNAPAETKLNALLDGCCRDSARQKRIEELEGEE
ncbi:MAG: hypothetical protein GY826_31295 [Fuerstiella sp.]|jgi:hypothetical protein|nr:hypothetical protein [Fuerstiella sp.]